MLVQVLYGVLQGNHVSIPVIIDLIYNGSKCGGFTASGRAGDQHQSTFALIQINHRFRYSQFFR